MQRRRLAKSKNYGFDTLPSGKIFVEKSKTPGGVYRTSSASAERKTYAVASRHYGFVLQQVIQLLLFYPKIVSEGHGGARPQTPVMAALCAL